MSWALVFPHPLYSFNKPRVRNAWLLSNDLDALASLWTSSPDMTLAVQIRVRFPPVYSNCQCFYYSLSELYKKFLTKMKVCV